MATCLAAATLLWSLTGCSASGGFDWSMLSTSPTPTPQAQAARSDEEGLRLAMPANSGAFDPLTNGSADMQELFSLVFEGLLRLGDQGQPEPWLAETMEKTQTGWTFTLRSGVEFHDGTLLSAQDVVNAFEALKQAGESGPYAGCLQVITSMSAQDNQTLLVETPYGYEALYSLCFPVARYPEQDGLAIGTGPYKVESYLMGVELKLVSSGNWWRKAPAIASLQATGQQEDPTVEQVQEGELDVALVELTMASSLYAYSRVGTQDYLTGRVELLLPNLEGALSDLRLRQAIAYLLDRREIITSAFQGHGVAAEVPVWPDSFLSEQVIAGEQDLDAAAALLEQMGFEDLDGDGLVERTANYVAPTPTPSPTPDPSASPEAGEAEASPTPSPSPTPTPTPSPTPEADEEEDEDEGVTLEDLLGDALQQEEDSQHLSLTLLVASDNSAEGTDAALCLQSQFRAAGIELEIESLPFEELLERMQAKEYDLALLGYQLGSSANLQPLLGSEGENNLMGYRSAAMDADLNALLSAESQEAYQVAAQRLYAQIQQDLPVFTLCMRCATRVTAPDLNASGTARLGDGYRGIENWSFGSDGQG